MSSFLDKNGLAHFWSELKTKLANKQDKITSTNKIPYSYVSDTPTIPTKTSQLTNDSGYTTNTGTITGITMNGVSKGTSGVVDLGTVITSHQDISGKAPTSHASSSTTYGVGTSSNYGHCKTINNLTSSSYGNGYALSAYQGYVLNQNKLDKTSVKTSKTTSNTDTYSCNYINSIIESGNNEYGQWVKFADGTMHCFTRVAVVMNIINVFSLYGGTAYYNILPKQQFAQQFVELNYCNISIESSGNSYALQTMSTGEPASLTSSQSTLIVSSASDPNDTIIFNLFAVGKWK